MEAAPKADFSPTFVDDDNMLERWYNDRFLIGLRQVAEISEYCNGRCFNCQKEGHHWHQYKEPFPQSSRNWWISRIKNIRNAKRRL